MSTKDFQKRIHNQLQMKLSENCEVKNEWVAFHGFRNHYSPRVDIAVGPFSLIAGDNKIEEYDTLLLIDNFNTFIRQAYDFHIQNIGNEYLNEIDIPDYQQLIHVNSNARCFLAIEIENNNSKKHILGSIVNAASLGRVGIGVAYNDRTLRTFIRLLNYLGFLKRVGKNTYDTTNFLILTKDQIESILFTNKTI